MPETYYNYQHSVNDFLRINNNRFLDEPTIRVIDSKKTLLEFKVTEKTLKEVGINFPTPLLPHYTKFDIHRAYVIDAASIRAGYGYFCGEVANAVDNAVTNGILRGAAAVAVKMDLSKFDGLTGLKETHKILQVDIFMYNDEIIPGK